MASNDPRWADVDRLLNDLYALQEERMLPGEPASFLTDCCKSASERDVIGLANAVPWILMEHVILPYDEEYRELKSLVFAMRMEATL